jgi:hypothetical protein
MARIARIDLRSTWLQRRDGITKARSIGLGLGLEIQTGRNGNPLRALMVPKPVPCSLNVVAQSIGKSHRATTQGQVEMQFPMLGGSMVDPTPVR